MNGSLDSDQFSEQDEFGRLRKRTGALYDPARTVGIAEVERVMRPPKFSDGGIISGGDIMEPEWLFFCKRERSPGVYAGFAQPIVFNIASGPNVDNLTTGFWEYTLDEVTGSIFAGVGQVNAASHGANGVPLAVPFPAVANCHFEFIWIPLTIGMPDWEVQEGLLVWEWLFEPCYFDTRSTMIKNKLLRSGVKSLYKSSFEIKRNVSKASGLHFKNYSQDVHYKSTTSGFIGVEPVLTEEVSDPLLCYNQVDYHNASSGQQAQWAPYQQIFTQVYKDHFEEISFGVHRTNGLRGVPDLRLPDSSKGNIFLFTHGDTPYTPGSLGLMPYANIPLRLRWH